MLTIGQQLIVEGEAKLLTTQLHHKFGTVSEEVQTRVDQASSAELNQWATRVLTAESPEAVVE